MKSESIAALAAALSQAQGEMKPAVMDSTNPFFRSRYASLPAIWESIRGPLSKNGLSVIQMPVAAADGRIGVRTILLHSSGEWISTVSEAGALPLKSKKREDVGPDERADGPQALGVVITYLRRYGLAAMIGQVAEEDDDAKNVENHAPARRPDPAPVSGAMSAQQRKMLWVLGCQLWQKEDEHGELKPDRERIKREFEQRSLNLGINFAEITSKQASALIEVLTDLEKKMPKTPQTTNDDLPF